MDERGTCLTCYYWDPELADARESPGDAPPVEGKCRRYPPFPQGLVATTHGDRKRGRYVRTTSTEWCGEWRPRQAAVPNEQSEREERELRNASSAQALMVLPQNKRDEVLHELLTAQEMESPFPPDDFYERVTRYFATRTPPATGPSRPDRPS